MAQGHPMLKANTVLSLLGLGIFISFVLLCFTSFVVMPKDVFRKSTYHLQSDPKGLQHSDLTMMNQRKSNSTKHQDTKDDNNSGVGKFPIRRVIENRGTDPPPPPPKTDKEIKNTVVKVVNGKPILQVNSSGLEVVLDKKAGRRVDLLKVDRALLAKTLRNHGLHPERVLALLKNVLNDD